MRSNIYKGETEVSALNTKHMLKKFVSVCLKIPFLTPYVNDPIFC